MRRWINMQESQTVKSRLGRQKEGSYGESPQTQKLTNIISDETWILLILKNLLIFPHARSHTWRSVNKSMEVFLSYPCHDSMDWVQAIRLGEKYIYSLSYFIIPQTCVYKYYSQWQKLLEKIKLRRGERNWGVNKDRKGIVMTLARRCSHTVKNNGCNAILMIIASDRKSTTSLLIIILK